VIGRVCAVSREDPESLRVITGTITIFDTLTLAFFDPGATHSFISWDFVIAHKIKNERMKNEMMIKTPRGVRLTIDSTCKDCLVKIRDQMMSATLYVLGINDFDSILGMD
jgi:hypothetical protein